MIQTESTPNPNSLKFLSEKTISAIGTEEFQKEKSKDLTEYIKDKFSNRSLFDSNITLTPLKPILKPHYALYFERHGPPIEGVFDSGKLAIIIKELLDNGTITEEDVFGNNSLDCSENET